MGSASFKHHNREKVSSILLEFSKKILWKLVSPLSHVRNLEFEFEILGGAQPRFIMFK